MILHKIIAMPSIDAVRRTVSFSDDLGVEEVVLNLRPDELSYWQKFISCCCFKLGKGCEPLSNKEDVKRTLSRMAVSNGALRWKKAQVLNWVKSYYKLEKRIQIGRKFVDVKYEIVRFDVNSEHSFICSDQNSFYIKVSIKGYGFSIRVPLDENEDDLKFVSAGGFYGYLKESEKRLIEPIYSLPQWLSNRSAEITVYSSSDEGFENYFYRHYKLDFSLPGSIVLFKNNPYFKLIIPIESKSGEYENMNLIVFLSVFYSGLPVSYQFYENNDNENFLVRIEDDISVNVEGDEPLVLNSSGAFQVSSMSDSLRTLIGYFKPVEDLSESEGS